MIGGATWACAVVTSVARASSRRPTFSHPGVAPAPRIRETTAAAAVGPTGLTNPSVATGLTNPITGTSPVVWTGPRGPLRNRSAERPRRSAGALTRRPRAPNRDARHRPRAVSRDARRHPRAVSRGPSRSVSPRRTSPGPSPSSSGASRDRNRSASAPDCSPPRSGALAFGLPTQGFSDAIPPGAAARGALRNSGRAAAGTGRPWCGFDRCHGRPAPHRHHRRRLDARSCHPEPAAAAAGSAAVITGSADAGGALDSAGVTGKIVFLAYGPGLNAIASKVLALRPLAVILVAGFPDSIWAKLPGHEASVIVRNPSEESGPAGPAVFAVRTATAGALFAQGGVSLDSLRTWADKPLAARPLTDVALQLDVRERVIQHASAPNSIGILEGSDPALKKEYVLF